MEMPDWTREPFAQDELYFMLWMTPAEWQLCYVLSFSWMEQEELNPQLPFGQGFRAVIHRLQTENGYSFSGLTSVKEDSVELYAKQKDPTCVEIHNWIVMMQGVSKKIRDPKTGEWIERTIVIPPDYETHFNASIAMCQADERLIELAPLLRDVWARLKQRLELEPPPDVEEQDALREQMEWDRKFSEATKVWMEKADTIN